LGRSPSFTQAILSANRKRVKSLNKFPETKSTAKLTEGNEGNEGRKKAGLIVETGLCPSLPSFPSVECFALVEKTHIQFVLIRFKTCPPLSRFPVRAAWRARAQALAQNLWDCQNLWPFHATGQTAWVESDCVQIELKSAASRRLVHPSGKLTIK
jgi:hypothetical protein